MRVLIITVTLISVSIVPSAVGGTFHFGAMPSASPTPQSRQDRKRNQRPVTQAEAPTADSVTRQGASFKYVFSQPDFVYRRMTVEHDSMGRGTFSFDRMGNDGEITERIQISQKVVDRLKASFDSLRFLESEENYQHGRDYAHLGTVELTLAIGDRERTARFNWTDNIQARALMDDYRRITQQFLWVFDINLSRENQPLESPGLMATLENLMRRGELADAEQLIPLLEELSIDERLPLIARNRAVSVIRSIRKD